MWPTLKDKGSDKNMVLKEVYRENFENANASDLAAATPTWNIRPSKANTAEHAPFNIIWIFNDSDEKLQVALDGDTDNYVVVNAKGILGFTLEDGISFNVVDIVNLSATDPAVNEVRVRIARIRDVQGVV